MAYDNRPNLNSRQFDQIGTDFLYLRGHNCICSGGTMSSNTGYGISGTTVFNTGSVLSSIQIGCNAISSGIASTSVGGGAKATGMTSIAVGCSAYAYGNGSISLGTLSTSNKLCSIAIGCGATALNDYGISIGADTQANGSGGIAIGNLNSASQYGISLGFGACTVNPYSTAIGNLGCAVGCASTSIGNNSVTMCNNSQVIGNFVCNTRKDSLALGWNNCVAYQAPNILFSNNSSYFYGSGDSKVGFGMCAPLARVDIFTSSTCGFRLADGNQLVSRVLTSDSQGFATWCNNIGWSNITNGSTVLGCDTINYCSTVCQNTFFGVSAGKAITAGSGNTATGYQAFCANTTGIHNNAMGNYALQYNLTGCGNVANGSYSLRFNTIGSDNIGLGWQALAFNCCGNSNIGIGNDALYRNRSGSRNIGFGYRSLCENTSGNDNIANGYMSVFSNTIGCCNIGLGSGALHNNITGSSNIAIGICSGYNELGSNKLYIANGASCTLIYGEFDNKYLKIDGCVCATSNMCAPNFILTSDERKKTYICNITPTPVNINYKQFELISEPNQLRYGVIAQELNAVSPEFVRIDKDGMYSVAYIDLLVKEVAYLKYKIEELEKRIK